MINRAEYVGTNLPLSKHTPESILSGVVDDEILDRMMKVINEESPIKESLLFKRVLNSFGLMKLGSRLEPYFNDIAERAPAVRISEDEKIYLKDDSEIDFFRYSSADLRYSYQIPVLEGVNAITYVLEKENRRLTRKELLQLFSETLSYQRKGSQVVSLFLACLDHGLRKGYFKVSGNHRYFI